MGLFSVNRNKAMIYSLAVYGSPFSHQSADTAYQFAVAALEQGHSILRIFFYQDGVHNATRLAVPPQDETNIPQRWTILAADHQIDMVVCVAAALRRGILDRNEARRYEKDSDNLAENFNIAGLGQLIDAGLNSDRLITFGA